MSDPVSETLGGPVPDGPALTCTPVEGLGEIAAGTDLGALIAQRAVLEDGDIVLVTSKVVSKSEGRATTRPKAQVLTEETRRVIAQRGATTIVRTRHGLVLAGAGIDGSNTPPGTVLALPEDPDRSSDGIRRTLLARTGRRVGVVVTDTAGRPWRDGQTDIAIGASGVVTVEDLAGRRDRYGNELEVTAAAVADELAAAADLVKGKLGGRPVAVIRGLARLVLADHGSGASRLVRPPHQDMFGFGAREAVRTAVRADISGTALEGFGAPADAVDLLAVLADLAVREPDADSVTLTAGSADVLATDAGGEVLEVHLAAPRSSSGARLLGRAESRLEAVAHAHGWVGTCQPLSAQDPDRIRSRARLSPAAV